VPCIKGRDSVKARISFLQNHEIIILPKCKNVITEFENFQYKKDKQGKLTEDMLHEFSHAIDGLGYAYSDIYTSNKLKTLDKAVLGL
jgi:phage terminase large subunit